MTDEERLLALLEDFGVRPEHGQGSVRLASGEGGVMGYPYFFCDFNFDPDGKFSSVGVWE